MRTSLKSHQVEGLKFMLDNCFDESIERIIELGLAHCMDLGKTLQAVKISHTVLSSYKLLNICVCNFSWYIQNVWDRRISCYWNGSERVVVCQAFCHHIWTTTRYSFKCLFSCNCNIFMLLKFFIFYFQNFFCQKCPFTNWATIHWMHFWKVSLMWLGLKP